MPGAAARRTYDHRIRLAVVRTGDLRLFPTLAIPESTARSWLRRGKPHVVALDARDQEIADLEARLARLERRAAVLGALALLAKRRGQVFASYRTWCRLVRERGWTRPRRRLYPAKPKVGLRAAQPDALWHVDVTVVRLLDGARAYLHAVVDNYSRRVLAWTLQRRLSSEGTRWLGGRTPDEAYRGERLDLEVRLRTAHAAARARRIEANRALRCGACSGRFDTPPSADQSCVP